MKLIIHCKIVKIICHDIHIIMFFRNTLIENNKTLTTNKGLLLKYFGGVRLAAMLWKWVDTSEESGES